VSAPILALALCFAGVFCLTPLAFYLLWLAGVNRRPRPTVISGPADFLALVGGLSGFLVFGLVIFVTVVQSNTRYGLRGNGAQLRELWDREKGYWLATAGAYVGFVVASVVVGYARRGRTLSVYGVDPDGATAVIDAEVAELNPTWKRVGYRWGDAVRVDPNRGMGHATVAITAADAGMAGELDRRLRRALADATPAAATPAGWFQSAAFACTVGAVCSLGLVLIYVWVLR
jgi:hypothetical protein